MILLGWEIGTGRRVEIPETGHLAWFGQTQLSGKTTALEAIAYRGALRAVAFITKQGEGGFLTGKMIQPYFSEPTNDEEQPLWRWVKSILEASQQRKMNFEESWIIRACEDPRRAQTLADVHKNIKDLLAGEREPDPVRNIPRLKPKDFFTGKAEKVMKRARGVKRAWIRKPVSGMNAGVYTSLKAYFDIVMPQLARLPYTKKLALGPGLNVMDLREYAMETQALVIRSVMEWVYQHEKGVRVIVPEAQDFVPQGKNSPVKMACETLVRKAGANKNFMWLDSQDMAAVDKIMLRACSIVGIGVQTEMHEIDRSLAGLFTPQLKPVDIARLKIGEFFVRTPEARVTKCYVQPAWMDSELHAQAIAKGEESVASARQMLKAFKTSQESKVQSREPKPHQLLQVQIQEPPVTEADELDSAHGVRGENDETSESIPHADAVSAAHAEKTDRDYRPGDSHGHVAADADSRALRGPGGGPRPSRDQNSPQHEENPSSPNLNDEVNYAANTGNSGKPGDVQDSRTPREAGAVAAPVSGALVSRENREADGRNEGAMPQEKTPYEIVRKSFGEPNGPRGIPALRFDRNSAKETADFLNAVHDLLEDHARLIEAHDVLAVEVKRLSPGAPVTSHQSPVTGNGRGGFTDGELDYIYKFVKASAAKDPGVLDLLTHRPELRVKVERQTVEMDDSTIIGRIARLVHEGYFKQARNGPTVQKELKRRGCDQPTTNLYKPLNRLTEMGFLTLEPDGYQEVPEMKVMVQKAP